MTDSSPPQLRRSLGFWALVFYGVGDILGAGIYALVGKVAGVAGSASWAAFGIALVVAGLTAITYAELARAAGAPRAVRAAARVMSTNVVPLVLPCHRVVPTGGGTGRYGWGDEVKQQLLALERAATEASG